MSSLHKACAAVLEGFTDISGIPTQITAQPQNALVEVGAAILSFSIVLVLVALFGKFLWNDAIVDLFTIAKPVKSIWPIIGLMLFMSLIR